MVETSISTRHENEITAIVIDTALEIHRRLGPGLLESVYSTILAYELRKRGLRVDREVPIPVEWDEIRQEIGFRADHLVDGKVIVEVKSIEAIAPVHRKVLLTYLRMMDKRVGLLINFSMELLKDGIHRVVNRLRDQPPKSRDVEFASGDHHRTWNPK